MPATDTARRAAGVAPRRLQWLTATVREMIDETPRVRSLVLDVPGWAGHRAGQHLDVHVPILSQVGRSQDSIVCTVRAKRKASDVVPARRLNRLLPGVSFA